MPNKGLLLTMTETPPALEAEFNDWYDAEHLPERLAIPGFISARRWEADLKPGQGKYLATYELESAAVLQSAAYLAKFRDAPTPWTTRMLGSCTVFKRWACEQIVPGNGSPEPAAKALLLACGEAPTERMPLPGKALSARHFLASSGEPRYIGLYELAGKDLALPRSSGDWVLQVYRKYAKKI
jgi:hypothetical protein